MTDMDLEAHCRKLYMAEVDPSRMLPAPQPLDAEAELQHLLRIGEHDPDYAVFAARRTEILVPTSIGLVDELIRRLNDESTS